LLKQIFQPESPFQLHDLYHYDQQVLNQSIQLYRSVKYMR
jgi:hypothetical protein